MKRVAVLAAVIAVIGAIYLFAFRGEGVQVVADDARIEEACPDGLVDEVAYEDVPVDFVHRPAIACVSWWNIAGGVGENRFAPEQPVTRAQLASFLAALMSEAGRNLPDEPADAFADDDGSIHEPTTNALASLGVVSGVGEDRFAPQQPVTRAQLATFLQRTYEQLSDEPLPSGTDAFTDDDGSTHEDAINALAEAGVVSGIGETEFAPTQQVTRAQLSTFLARLLAILVEQDDARLPYLES